MFSIGTTAPSGRCVAMAFAPSFVLGALAIGGERLRPGTYFARIRAVTEAGQPVEKTGPMTVLD